MASCGGSPWAVAHHFTPCPWPAQYDLEARLSAVLRQLEGLQHEKASLEQVSD